MPQNNKNIFMLVIFILLILTFSQVNVALADDGTYICKAAKSTCPNNGKGYQTKADCEAACPSGGLGCFTGYTCNQNSTLNCPSVGQTVPVTLNPVSVKINLYKPFEVTYDKLNLQFISQTASSLCSLKSNEGILNVLVTWLLIDSTQYRWATSTTSATLNYFHADEGVNIPQCVFSNDASSMTNNCFLNAPPNSSDDIIVSWETPGFKIEIPPNSGVTYDTGPRIYWVDLKDLGLGSSDSLDANNINKVENFIHQTLIKNLSIVDNIGIIQDPPANSILVTSPNGLQIGRLPSGNIISEISGSTYFTSKNITAIMIPEIKGGNYKIAVTGNSSGRFSLSLAVINFSMNQEHIANEIVINDTIMENTTKFYNMTVSNDKTVLIPEFNSGVAVVTAASISLMIFLMSFRKMQRRHLLL